MHVHIYFFNCWCVWINFLTWQVVRGDGEAAVGRRDVRRCSLEECLNHLERSSRSSNSSRRIIISVPQPAGIRSIGSDLILREDEHSSDADMCDTPSADMEPSRTSLDDLLDLSSASARFAAEQLVATDPLPTFWM